MHIQRLESTEAITTKTFTVRQVLAFARGKFEAQQSSLKQAHRPAQYKLYNYKRIGPEPWVGTTTYMSPPDATSQAIGEHPELQPAFQQLSHDLASAMGVEPAESQLIGFGTDTAQEMNALLAQLFPGVPLETLQGGVLVAGATGGLWITLEGMWDGLQMITYKFHADPVLYDVPYISPSQTTPSPVPTTASSFSSRALTPLTR